MHRPAFLDQFLPAVLATTVVLLAAIAGARLGPRAKPWLFAAAAVVTTAAFFLSGFVVALPLPIDTGRAVVALAVGASLVTFATALPRPRPLTLGALAGQALLFLLDGAIRDFTPALVAAQLTFVALFVALELRASARAGGVVPAPAEAKGAPLDDAAIFLAALAVAAVVCDRVLERYTLSGDEWADTWQADVFAHLRAWAQPRPCEAVFKNWWVFEKDGRMFAQYTPGWPLVMAPFQRLGAAWLAGPFVFGFVAVGVARLARRVARGGLAFAQSTSTRSPRLAGALAALFLIASPSALLNGASRYPHTLASACFAWMVEALFALSEARRTPARIAWGALLGVAAALLLAVRPLDGAGVGVGVFVVFACLLLRRDLPFSGVAAAAVAFAALGALTLVLLRLQLGAWFVTGYSLSPFPAKLSIPPPGDLAYAFRLDKGTGWWFPCAVPFVPLGLLLASGRARRVAWALFLGGACHTALYALVELGRDAGDSGYGPRFHLPLVVPMAVAGGVLFAALFARARRAAAVASLAALGGFAGVALVAYPYFARALHEKASLARAIRAQGLHHAVVVVDDGDLSAQAWDLTQNLPSDPEPDVMVVTNHGAGPDFACAEARWADRAWFRARQERDASGAWTDVVVLAPFPR